jgi:hypothetical protein
MRNNGKGRSQMTLLWYLSVIVEKVPQTNALMNIPARINNITRLNFLVLEG